MVKEGILQKTPYWTSWKQRDQVIYRYCDEQGNITDASNPNGATRNIAGICNSNRNVFGMMPHPERASTAALGNTDGRLILKSLLMERLPELV